MHFLMTTDVEEFSIPLNRLDDATAWRVYREGLPKLLDLYSKYDVESTFYFTGTFAEKIPEAMELVMERGHEIGCHGYDHSVHRYLGALSYEDQLSELTSAKKAITSVCNDIVSFRAPAGWINNDTVRVLENCEFTSDSSIASQRFDGPLSYGTRDKMNGFFAPRCPYPMSSGSPYIRGTSPVLEIPISAFLLGYVGTTMRVAPPLNRYLGKFLFREAEKNGKPIVFLFHPNEAIGILGQIERTRRAKTYLGHLFADVIRQQLKLRNLGPAALKLLEAVLAEARTRDATFITMKRYRNHVWKGN